MIDTNKLRGCIAERGFSQREVAREIGITENTFYRKIKEKRFDSDEIEAMILLLDIKNPVEIFFANVGA